MLFPMRLQPFQSRYAGLPTQLKYAMLLTLVAGFMTLLMIFVMAWFIQRNYNLFMGDELGISAQVIEVVRHEQRLLEVSLFVLFLLSITITFTTTFFVTRKLTGPVVALERHLWHYVRGDWSRDFRLRRNDEFKELETLMNQLRSTMLTQANRRTEGQRDSA
jgi:HAMP domain-containing protein